jgi:hypothetical protein
MPTVVALVEMWHDDAHSPDLIACIPTDFTQIERTSLGNDDLSLLTNLMKLDRILVYEAFNSTN